MGVNKVRIFLEHLNQYNTNPLNSKRYTFFHEPPDSGDQSIRTYIDGPLSLTEIITTFEFNFNTKIWRRFKRVLSFMNRISFYQ